MRLLSAVQDRLANRMIGGVRRAWALRQARRRLLHGGGLTDREKRVLAVARLRVHRRDGMYVQGQAGHYLATGLGALRTVDAALAAAGERSVGTVLDFGCGYGRVLRFLRAGFPRAEITVTEIEPWALSYCRSAFRAMVLPPCANPADLPPAGPFDLIWCGSVLTHLPQSRAEALLRFFHDRLTDRGLCVFTTHGRESIELLRQKRYTYGLSEQGRADVLAGVLAGGYGYAGYTGMPGYGISVATHERIGELARDVGAWREVLFLERGWDGHQDVHAYAR